MIEETPSLVRPVDDGDHMQGSMDAPLILVEYGDYQCPYCGRAYPVVKEVQRRLGERLCFVFRNMPLREVHEYAELEAEAAEAAGAQGKFWEMHDALYEHQAELGPRLVQRLAREIGLDVPRLEEDLVMHRFQAHVREDFMSGVRSGVPGTPTFYVQGRRFDGDWQDPDAIVAALEGAAAPIHDQGEVWP